MGLDWCPAIKAPFSLIKNTQQAIFQPAKSPHFPSGIAFEDNHAKKPADRVAAAGSLQDRRPGGATFFSLFLSPSLSLTRSLAHSLPHIHEGFLRSHLRPEYLRIPRGTNLRYLPHIRSSTPNLKKCSGNEQSVRMYTRDIFLRTHG